MADVAEFVGLVIVHADYVGLGNYDLLIEFIAFLVVHLGDEVAAEEVGDDTFLGDFEAALGAKAVDRLHLEPATWVNDAVGQLL